MTETNQKTANRYIIKLLDIDEQIADPLYVEIAKSFQDFLNEEPIYLEELFAKIKEKYPSLEQRKIFLQAFVYGQIITAANTARFHKDDLKMFISYALKCGEEKDNE